MRFRVSALSLTVALAVLAPFPASAQAVEERSDRLTAASYLDYETVAGPRLSPDGRQIVYTRRWINKLSDRWESELWMLDAEGGNHRFFSKGSAPQWSPDGGRIAYLAEGEPDGTQIFVRWLEHEGPPTQITREQSSPADLRWSPDGRSLGFTAIVPSKSTWPISLPAAPEGAKWTPAPRYVERLHYRQDRVGFMESGFVHLFVVSADGGTARQLTSGEWNVGARFDGLRQPVTWSWSPDGATIVVEGYRGEDADLNYRDSHLYAVDLASGFVRQLTQEAGTWGQPAFAPDGKSIAYTGYPKVRQTYRADDLYLMNADGTGVRLLSEGFDRTPDELHWSPDGRGVYFTAQDQGTSNLFYAASGGGVRPVTTGTHMLALGNLARNHVAVAARSSYHKPSDVVRVNLRRPSEITQLTAVNEDLLKGRRLGEVEELWYVSGDGTRVQGWLVRPPDFDPSRKYPLLLEIHGGPHGMYNVGFNPFFQLMASRGYVVLYTNPRGSTGYGTAFGNAIDLAYPGVDYNDLMAGVDTVVARGFVDERRLFVGGCSGGGVLSSWVIGHTTRFAGAAVRCPVTNWLSFAGQTDVPLFTHNFFAKPFWEDPSAWLRQSTLMHVGKVQTPTLLMTGVQDLRTPISQTDEYFAALRMRGIPSAVLRFEGEWHGTMSKPSNFLRTVLYMDAWFQKYAGREAATEGR